MSAGASPMAAADREHQQMMADIRMLQAQAQLLQQQLAAVTEALRAVTVKLDEQSGVSRKAFADQKLLVDNVAGDLRIVREKVDEGNVRITSLSQELEALRLTIPQQQAAGLPLPGGEPVEGEAVPPPMVPQPGVTPQRLFDIARADFAAGQWPLALQGFDTYIKMFPRTELADDAQFYIGDTHYNDGNFVEAVSAYDKVITEYPDSNRVADAYYKRGLALNELGQRDRARQSFDYVVKNHPDTAAGRMAKQALDRLARQGRD
jgi:tol-pal system protein YbgF